jgi:hypothetical protein
MRPYNHSTLEQADAQLLALSGLKRLKQHLFYVSLLHPELTRASPHDYRLGNRSGCDK